MITVISPVCYSSTESPVQTNSCLRELMQLKHTICLQTSAPELINIYNQCFFYLDPLWMNSVCVDQINQILTEKTLKVCSRQGQRFNETENRGWNSFRSLNIQNNHTSFNTSFAIKECILRQCICKTNNRLLWAVSETNIECRLLKIAHISCQQLLWEVNITKPGFPVWCIYLVTREFNWYAAFFIVGSGCVF